MDAAFLALAGILMGAGLVGCVLPVLPGPPLSFAGLVLQWWVQDWQAESYGWPTVAVLGVLAAVVTVLDLLAPVYGARRYGASRAGIWGSVIGLLVGMFTLGPFGMVIGAFVGALGGEWLAGKADADAWKAAWGVFVGTMLGVGLKLVVCVVILGYFLMELFA